MDTPEKATQIATPLSKFEIFNSTSVLFGHLLHSAFWVLVVLRSMLVVVTEQKPKNFIESFYKGGNCLMFSLFTYCLLDSPVFNYINSLSPIKPVKSIPITQTYNSLNFSSLPSIFTSPHVIAHRETRFLRRNNFSDPSKAGSSSENGNKVCTDDGVAMDASQLYDNSTQLQENFDNGVSIEEDSVEPSSDSKFVIELPRALKYDCGSPGCNSTPCSVIEANCVSEQAGTSASVVPFVEKDSENGSFEDEVHLQGASQIEQKKEEVGCDWESLISDAQDLLIFNYHNESEAFKGLIQKSMDPGERFCTSLVTRFSQNDLSGEPKLQMVDSVGCSQQHEMMETSELKEINEIEDNLANDDLNNCLTGNPSENVNDEVGVCVQDACKRVPTLHRGMLRRCLDFERVARRKNLNDGSNCSSSIILQSNEEIASEDNQLMPLRPTSDSPRCILPGIGLHLNALTLASQDNKNFKLEIFSRQLSLPTSTASIHSPESGQEPVQESLTSAAAERDMVPVDDGVPLAEDASQTSAYLVGEERRMELAGESESACKRCNCKKSKCLKLYCECFAAGVYCIEPCSCQDCFNKPIHEDTVLATRKQIESRNPLAFAPKVIRNSDSVPEQGDESSKTPASARHKRGCNCKKSSCLKKYCECYQGGVGCSINCRCEGCKNTFGRKDGSAIIETDAEQEEEESETCEKSGVDPILQRTEISNNEEQNQGSAHPTTPLQFSRPLVQLPFSSKFKPPRSLLSIGSSTAFYTGLNYGKPSILRSQPKFEKRLQTAPDEEMPEILQGNSSPGSGVKTVSPNSKRVSPPNNVLGSSPSRRSGRKLILQSIPSFPSLTPQH
ncbi:hypothetical protein EZV62_000685 [Acer yangbiense]|uniref:CRC domain-containing protein n=1 Tax=Acer yangbiense TaxID=1000413 RepID=A0A5C7IUI5_9ROSI|nr:hypothetical protein EZV62_000685 [Acer yangbiense]